MNSASSLHWQIQRFACLNSTQSYLQASAKEFPEGTVIVAEQQTHGLGRKGRSWHSEPGGLYFSFLLKPPELLNDLPLSLLFAVCQTLETLSGQTLTLKWPNDLLANGSKLAGMLIDAQIQGTRPLYYLCGMGINLNQAHFPGSLSQSATSLAQLTQKHWPAEQVLAPLLENIGQAYERLKREPRLWHSPEQPLGLRPIQIGYNTQETKTLGELLEHE